MTDEIEALETAVNDLRLQISKLKGQLSQQIDSLMTAKIAAFEADLSTQGITPGCKVMVVRLWNGSERRSGPYGYLGAEPGYWGEAVRPRLVKIKKDGTPGKRGAAFYDQIRLELV